MMEFFKTADVVVIGGGIVGTAILRELSKYDLKCVLVEKEPDLAAGTTKANSAILHAGFDAPTGSLKAVTNVRGNKLYHELQKELGLDIEWTGSLVAATSEEEMQTLQELLERGQKNGVEGLRILNREEVLAVMKQSDSVEFLFQEMIENSTGRDVRLQVVGDEVVASMYRYSENDFRANITAGGKMKDYTPSKEECELAVKASHAVGTSFAGVDLLFGKDGPIVCEVNSNAHFKNIQTCTGVAVADKIVEWIIKDVRK